ncbi:hypothetical protein [Leeia oryzae]|uniref:hypothetical protein n=1 Tax=Leeia oryzae TaxID=356662 RepID=UPI000379A13F|nr:hypothetical protein [Leeia oryzae]
MAHWYLLSDEAGMQVWRKQHANMQQHAFYPADDAGITSFRFFLNTHARDRFSWLFETAQETVHHERLPAIARKLATRVLNRRLLQRFATATYRMSILQQPFLTADHQWLGQLLVLEEEGGLAPWAALIQASAIQVDTMQSVFGVMARPKLPVPVPSHRHAVWVVMENRYLRVLVYSDAGLLLIRKLPASLVQEHTKLGKEIQKTCDFAFQQAGIATIADDVPVLVSLESVRAAESRFVFEQLGWQIDDRPTTGLTPLMLHALADLQNEPGFLPDVAKQMRKHKQVKQQLWCAAAALLLVLLLVSGFVYQRSHVKRYEQTRLEHDYARLLTQPESKIALLAPDNVDVAQAQAVVQTARLLAQWPEPADILTRLSQGIAAFPSIRLDEINWQLGVADKLHTWPPQQMSLVLQGHFVDVASDLTAHNAQVVGLQSALSRLFPQTSILILKWPVDTGSTVEISNEALHGDTANRFSMQLNHPLISRK